MKYALLKSKLREAATLKTRVQRMIRDFDEALEDKDLPEDVRAQVKTMRSTLKRTWGELEKESSIIKASEADSKPGDYLVVEDPEKSSTWHLQVKNNGKPDHGLMGAAWAALHGGYRGNKYEGTGKADAIKKLQALYKSEKMEVPAGEVAECYDDDDDEDDYPTMAPMVTTWGARSFGDIDAAEAAEETTREINERTVQLQQLISNVMGDINTPDKVSALAVIFDEYKTIISDLTGANLNASESAPPQHFGQRLAESVEGAAITLAEADDTPPSPRDPLKLNVKLIVPGWGNRRDNNYYPADVLKRDAPNVFEGLKMYTTDHKDGEKSERTEVSMIEKIVGFTPEGAPIARVNVFDPTFAEKVRNRAKANVIESLECSILAYGKTKPGKIGERQGNIVEAITSAQSVDWVTKAGAGGHALNLAENDPGANTQGVIMDKALILKLLGESALPKPAQTRLALSEYVDEAALKAAIESEGVYLKEAAPPAPEQPALLSEAEVKTEISKHPGLPVAAQKRLAGAQYKDLAELQAAITDQVTYLKEVSGSGRPLAPQSRQPADKIVPLAERNKTVDGVLARHFPGQPAPLQRKGA